MPGFHDYVRIFNATQRSAPYRSAILPARRKHLRKNDGSSCLSQALALPTFFATFLSNGMENACGAMRCVTESWKLGITRNGSGGDMVKPSLQTF